MAVQGLEAERDALKHRCPAAAHGLECAGCALCSQRAGVAAEGFGRTLHIPLKQVDPRIFTPTPAAPRHWRRACAHIDDSSRFERHNIRGKDRMTAQVALALAVMMALALGSIRAKAHDRMRSLLVRLRKSLLSGQSIALVS